MILIFTMAGEFSRFFDFSMKIPKFLLPYHNGLVLDAILDGFTGEDLFTDIVFACHRKDNIFRTLIKERNKLFPKSKTHIVFLEKTISQVQTASLAIKHMETKIDVNRPCIISNIDTILNNRNYKLVSKQLSENFGYLDTFQAFNRAYSYIVPSQNQKVKQVREKVVISKMACSGLYGIQSAKIFNNQISENENNFSNFSEYFQWLINSGHSISYQFYEDSLDTIVLGSPEQYMEQISSSNFS